MKTTALSMTGLALVLVMGTAGLVQAQGMERGGPAFGMPVLSYDADGDGKVTAEEVAAKKAERFEAADADGDGLLSAEEVGAYAEALRAERAALRNAALVERLDQDGDGLLSADEIAGMRPASTAFDRMLERLDTDEDGALSEAELQAAKERMGERDKRHHKEMRGEHRGGHKQMRGERGEHRGGEMRGERDMPRGEAPAAPVMPEAPEAPQDQ